MKHCFKDVNPKDVCKHVMSNKKKYSRESIPVVGTVVTTCFTFQNGFAGFANLFFIILNAIIYILSPLTNMKLDKRMDIIEDDIKTGKSDVVNIKDDIETGKGDVVNIKGDIVDFEDNLINIEDDVVNIKDDIETGKKRQDKFQVDYEEQIKSMTEQMNSMREQIKSLTEQKMNSMKNSAE